jgi:hypothetical protein
MIIWSQKIVEGNYAFESFVQSHLPTRNINFDFIGEEYLVKEPGMFS